MTTVRLGPEQQSPSCGLVAPAPKKKNKDLLYFIMCLFIRTGQAGGGDQEEKRGQERSAYSRGQGSHEESMNS